MHRLLASPSVSLTRGAFPSSLIHEILAGGEAIPTFTSVVPPGRQRGGGGASRSAASGPAPWSAAFSARDTPRSRLQRHQRRVISRHVTAADVALTGPLLRLSFSQKQEDAIVAYAEEQDEKKNPFLGTWRVSIRPNAPAWTQTHSRHWCCTAPTYPGGLARAAQARQGHGGDVYDLGNRGNHGRPHGTRASRPRTECPCSHA